MSEPFASIDGSVIALDGDLPDAALIRALHERSSALVAADGAAVKLWAMGILPDVVVGDLDSIGPARAMLEERGAIVLHDPSQETNDFEKGLQWLVDRGETAAVVIGIGGGMIDHVLNNFSVLAKYARRLRLRLRDDRSTGYLVSDSLTLTTSPGDRISLIPLPSARLTTTGLAWELRDETLALGLREGGSNRAVADTVQIELRDGLLLVFRYHETDEEPPRE